MTLARIHRIFLEFRALSWAARELRVNKGTLYRFLSGERPATERASDLRVRAERLAQRLVDTNGAAKRDVNGESVRSHLRRKKR